MKHHLVAIPRRYGILFHLLAGMCICILANYSNSTLDLLPIKFFLEEINRGVFNHFFDEEMKKVDEIVLSQIRFQNKVTIYDNTPIFSWQSIKETLLNTIIPIMMRYYSKVL